MLTSCHWRRRSAPRCVRRRVLPHGSDSLSAVTSVPAPRSTRRARNRWIHACGVEPSLHRDRIISGSKPHRNPAFKQRERAQTHREVLPRRQRVSVQTDMHAIVEMFVLRGRAVSASRSAKSRDSNRISIQRAQTHREVLPRRQRVFAQIDVHAIVEIHVLRSRAVHA